MDRYRALGARPTFTCAPYQLADSRPGLGEQVAWGESNAIAFCNSVLGARTNRYGDFLDIAAAITGRVPDAGLHRTDARRATLVLRLADDVPARLRDGGRARPGPRAHPRTAGGVGGGRDRRAAARAERGPAEGDRRRRGLLRIGGDVPRRRVHAGGLDPGRGHPRHRGANRGGDAGGAAGRPRRADERRRPVAGGDLSRHAARIASRSSSATHRCSTGGASMPGSSASFPPAATSWPRPRSAGSPAGSGTPVSSCSSTRAATSLRSCGTPPVR